MNPLIQLLTNLNYVESEGGYVIKRIERLKGLIQKGLVIPLSKILYNGWFIKTHGPVYLVRQTTYKDAKRRYKDKDIPEGTGFATMRLELCDHSGTHIDGLNHVSDRGKIFGGISIEEVDEDIDGFKTLDISLMPPIITRGILFYVPKNRVEEVTVEDLKRALGDTQIEKGDAAIIYTGWKEYSDEEPGIGLEAAKWLAEKGVAIIGNDAPRSEFISKNSKDFFPVHRFLIAQKGIPIIDNMYLDDLVNVLLKEGRKDFLFIALPLRLKGATASPINPIALI
jgi:kynurenine formamidase